MKVVLCVPTLTRPHSALLEAIEAAVPALDAAGITHQMVMEVGNPYISQARNVMLRKALDAGADQIIFLDHDVSFPPEALPPSLKMSLFERRSPATCSRVRR